MIRIDVTADAYDVIRSTLPQDAPCGRWSGRAGNS